MSNLLSIDPIAGESEIKAHNEEGNEGRFQAAAGPLESRVLFQASFNGESKEVFIQGSANATEAILEYLADQHIYSEGVNEYADNTAALAAGLRIGAIYRTGDFQKIVH